jgi:hypothetical protein
MRYATDVMVYTPDFMTIGFGIRVIREAAALVLVMVRIN